MSLQTLLTEPPLTPVGGVNAQGFSLHAEACCAADQRKKLEQLCRYITRPAIANERLTRNRAGVEIDIEQCPQCGGTLKLIATIEDPRDRQDPYPPRLVRPGTAPIARAAIRPIPNGLLIPGRAPLPPGSTPRADSLLWPALAREAKTPRIRAPRTDESPDKSPILD